MHKRLKEIVDFLDESRADLLRSFEEKSNGHLTRKPRPERWSVAEVLDHLANVEAGVGKMFKLTIPGAKAEGIPDETSDESVIGTFDAFSFPHTRDPFEAPTFTHPKPDLDPADVIERLRSSRTALLVTLEQANGLDLTKMEHKHILLGQLNYYQWLLFLGQHEARHAGQIRNTLKETE